MMKICDCKEESVTDAHAFDIMLKTLLYIKCKALRCEQVHDNMDFK
jgi:hypothetical protein